MPTIAVLSDIHGTLPALEAVVADLNLASGRDPNRVLGDTANVCPMAHRSLEL